MSSLRARESGVSRAAPPVLSASDVLPEGRKAIGCRHGRRESRPSDGAQARTRISASADRRPVARSSVPLASPREQPAIMAKTDRASLLLRDGYGGYRQCSSVPASGSASPWKFSNPGTFPAPLRWRPTSGPRRPDRMSPTDPRRPSCEPRRRAARGLLPTRPRPQVPLPPPPPVGRANRANPRIPVKRYRDSREAPPPLRHRRAKRRTAPEKPKRRTRLLQRNHPVRRPPLRRMTARKPNPPPPSRRPRKGTTPGKPEDLARRAPPTALGVRNRRSPRRRRLPLPDRLPPRRPVQPRSTGRLRPRSRPPPRRRPNVRPTPLGPPTNRPIALHPAVRPAPSAPIRTRRRLPPYTHRG